MSFIICSAIFSEVSGPVAIITIPFLPSILSTSFLIISILELLLISSVILLENFSLSTAKACPAGTFVSSATLINNESSFLNSSFNSPQAFVILFDLNELLHTISAKLLLLCAGENFSGFISYSLTFIPLLAT